MPIFALVDCNNFYASCERVFNPRLIGKPVVVLSNNDGCVVARSNEAKDIGIPMGTPLFKVRDLVKSRGVKVLSSNYALYADMSRRVVEVLSSFTPDLEVYSIDESFLDLAPLRLADPEQFCRTIRAKVLRWTGIPVSIGLGPSKTLAKVANRLAKKNQAAKGVVDLFSHPERIEAALRATSIGDVWGIGYRWEAKLQGLGIKDAWALRNASEGVTRKTMGNVGLRTVLELRGMAIHTLGSEPAPKQTLCRSHTFSRAVRTRDEVQDAVTAFTTRAAEKLREGNLVAGALSVFILTDRFDKNARQRSASAAVAFDFPTDDSREMVRAAVEALTRAWKNGYAYRKAGVLLFDLADAANRSRDLFEDHRDQSARCMAALDNINERFGRGTLTFGLSSKRATWRGQSRWTSPAYTTKWGDLPVISGQLTDGTSG